MSSSTPIPGTLDVTSITFNDNTRLVSASNFIQNTRFRKRLRVDKEAEFREDITVYGNIHVFGSVTSGDPAETPKQYVDNQTGWGLPQWTFAGALYNPTTDSLIIKITNIEVNYATIAYVDSQLQNTNGKYFVPYAPNTFPTLANPSVTYPYAITTLSSNTGLIIRDVNSAFNEFKFQRGNITVGNVLRCLDAEGTVGWGPENNSSTEAQTIGTSYGATNLAYSWKVYDVPSGRGILAFPNFLSNLYNKAITPNATGILMGTGDIINYQHPFILGCYSNGTEMIQFINSTSATSPNGSVRITGGSANLDQQIQLNSEGMFFAPRYNAGIQFILPKVTKNLSLNEWTKPVSIFGKLQQNDEYPTLIVTKENANAEKMSIMFNPRPNNGHFNHLAMAGNPQIIFADSTQFDQNGTTSVIPTVSTTLLIAPWSYKCDGVQIKNSLESEDTPGSMISGYTRITGCSDIVVDGNRRWPFHYVETNRQGIFLKNSASTTTTNYGPFKVISRNGAIMNNSTNEIIPAYFQVGDMNEFTPSTFYGNINMLYGFLYYKVAPSVNYVLTCSSLDGKAEWKPVSVEYPSTVVNDTTFNGNVTINGNLEIPNVISSTNYDTINVILSALSQTTSLSFDTNPNSFTYNYLPNRLTTYYWKSNIFPIATVTVPKNSDKMVNLKVPYRLNITWRYRDNRQASDEVMGHWWNLEKYTIFVYDENNQLITSWDQNNDFIRQNKLHTNKAVHNEYHIRTLSGTQKCDRAATTWKYKIPMETIDILFAPPYNKTQNKTYYLRIQTYGKYWNDGEYCYMTEINHQVNYVLNVDNYGSILERQVIIDGSDPDPYASIAQQNVSPYYFCSNLGVLDGNINSMPYAYSSEQVNLYTSESAPLSYGYKTFKVGTMTAQRMIIENELYVPNGVVYAKGIAGRPGISSTTQGGPIGKYDDRTYNSPWSYRNWESVFNFYWDPLTSKVQTYVDSTKVLEFSANYSDYRMKTNLRMLNPVLERLVQVDVYQYDTIQYGAFGASQNKIGVIAHELENKFTDIPHLVNNKKDETDINGNLVLQSIDQREMTFVLMKAIQELKAEIDSLKSEIQLLKSSFSASS